MTQWSEVRAGDLVLGAKDRQPWEVMSRDETGKVTIRNGKRNYTFTPSGPVELIATGPEIMAAAEASIKIIMPGAVEVARQDTETKAWSCPKSFPDVGTMQAHCYVLHGKRSREEGIYEILAEHNQWHKDDILAHPHVHTPDFWDGGS